jgi:hypothetical protein
MIEMSNTKGITYFLKSYDQLSNLVLYLHACALKDIVSDRQLND